MGSCNGRDGHYLTLRNRAGPLALNNSGVVGPAHQPLTAKEMATLMKTNLITSSHPITKLNVPKLRRMGDAASAEVLNILKTRGPLSANEQQNVLQIVHKAFENPAAVRTPVSRISPQSSLTLLDQLNSSTTDMARKTQIIETREFVLTAAGWR